MSLQAQDLINDAGKTLGVLQSGETFNSDELNDGLRLANYMIENWNTQGLLVFQEAPVTQGLTANQTTPYTMGTGGNINANRPVKIVAAGIIQSNGARTPLKLIGAREYAEIISKADVSVVPTKLYNDNAFPTVNLYLHPWSSGTPTLDLLVWSQLSDNFALTDTLAFPSGYYAALRYNLAKELLAIFPREIDAGLQVVLDMAKSLKQELIDLRGSNVTAEEFPENQQTPPAAPNAR